MLESLVLVYFIGLGLQELTKAKKIGYYLEVVSMSIMFIATIIKLAMKIPVIF